MLVNILSSGLSSPNSVAFLHPILRYKKSIESNSVKLNIHYKLCNEIYSCDLLIIDSKFFSSFWGRGTELTLQYFYEFKKIIGKVYFFDIMDSTTWDQIKVLPYVDRYYKCQLLKDRKMYGASYYGNRIFTDFYHKKFNVSDDNEEYSEPIIDGALLDKLKVSWNTSLSNYSYLGLYKLEIYKKINLDFLLYLNSSIATSPLRKRANNVSCRVGNLHGRKTVAWQRLEVRKILKGLVETKKIGRKKYFNEMVNSKLSVSPFGFGEISLRDFEIILCGSLLVKPDMSHVDTWPNLYKNDVTYCSYDWDMSNLEEVLENVLANENKYLDVAVNAQHEYVKHIVGNEAEEKFVSRFLSIVLGEE